MNDSSVFERRESRVRSYSRAFPTTFAQALGSELRDVSGRRWIDFLAGCGSLNYGHNDPLLKQALLEYVGRDGPTHGLDMQTEAKAALLESLEVLLLAPRGLDHVVQFTGPTGANAVEAALKLARKVTGRSSVVFFTNGFHGVSLGALAITGNAFQRAAAGQPLTGSVAMPYEGYFGASLDTIAWLERLVDDPSSGVDLPAAVIVEAVQGEGGLNAASEVWLRRLRAFCDARSVLMIIDDIQAGCGRTGDFFSFERAGIVPDMITLAKSISGYGLPLSLLLIRPRHDVWEPAEHNGTFRGNNHAFVTAEAALRHYWSDGTFGREIRVRGEQLQRRLVAMAERFPDDIVGVRGRCMMRGLHCADPARAARITACAYREGLIIERSGPRDEVIKCLMPLTIEPALLDEGLDILEHAVHAEYATREHAPFAPASLGAVSA